MKQVPVRDILEENRQRNNFLGLKTLTAGVGTDKLVRRIELNRPGLALAGFFLNFASERIQVFGRGEHSYLRTLGPAALGSFLGRFFGSDVVLCVFTHGTGPMPAFIRAAKASGTCVLSSRLHTSEFITLITQFLESRLAPSLAMHGTLIEVFGVGVLISGDSGIGKSETALELVKRGHRLIADDVVHVRKIAGSILIGQADELLGYRVEIRGLGIIDIQRVFGVGAVKRSKRVDMIIRLEDWNHKKSYDRLGLDRKYQRILGVRVPAVAMPVKAGRNIAVIIETAAMNKRLQDIGISAARELETSLREKIASASEGKAVK